MLENDKSTWKERELKVNQKNINVDRIYESQTRRGPSHHFKGTLDEI